MGRSVLAGLFGEGKGVDLQDQLFEQAFQLACFIVEDRREAIRILIRAVNKLKTQCDSEIKKNYWRDKYLKRRITRIARSDSDTFQWLIYFESDEYELEQERLGQWTERDMVLRYIKCLVRITGGMSSFYVNIGLNRLLYNYSTAELQRLYESLTHRYPGPDEYRRGKRLVTERLQLRFGDLLTLARSDYGEMRFTIADDQAAWAELARNCLAAFTPWSTNGNCPIPAGFDFRVHDLASSLTGDKKDEKVDQNAIETRRCHALIDPGCFIRLTNGLQLDLPDSKLAVPQFGMTNENNKRDKPGGPPVFPSLTEQELSEIKSGLASAANRRSRALPQSLRVMMDGVEVTTMRLDDGRDSTLKISEGAKLIEIRTEHEGEDILLASHFIKYDDWLGVASSSAVVPLRGAGQLTLSVSASRRQGDSGGGVMFLSFRPRVSGFPVKMAILRRPFVPVVSLAFAIVLAVGWMLNSSALRRELAEQRTSNASLQHDLAGRGDARAAIDPAAEIRLPSYMLLPDAGITRGGDNTPFPVISLSDVPGLITLQLPIEVSGTHPYRATITAFAAREEILVESGLQPTHLATGSAVEFQVPSSLLVDGGDYTAHLWLARKAEEVGSFTFHVKRKK
jgi:hypothetical protein